jgi:predicted glycosyltransferase
MKRVMVFTHDTFGLGHVRRCLHIVRELCRRMPDAAVLLVTGSPAPQAMRDLPPNADFVKLPTIVKTGSAESRPPHLPIELREVTSIRKRILRSSLDSFRPDLLLVDNFPLGSRKELRPVLEHARSLGVISVLGLRDIVDRPEVVRSHWSKDGIYDALRELYDRVLVYGVPEILDAVEAYGLSPELGDKVRYCGYVTSTEPPSRDARELRDELQLAAPLVLATVGGGGDGFPLLSSFVRAVTSLDGVSGLAVTGPLMAHADRERIRRGIGDTRRVVVEPFVPDLPSYIASADLVVAMGGYNTVAELLALRRRALILPRNWRYGEFARGTDAGQEWEQQMRAEALERLGLVQVLSADCFEPRTLAAEIRAALDRADTTPVPAIDVGGVHRAVDELIELMQSEVHRAQVR